MAVNIYTANIYSESTVEIQLKCGKNSLNVTFTALWQQLNDKKRAEVFWMHSAIAIYFSENICSVWILLSNINIID